MTTSILAVSEITSLGLKKSNPPALFVSAKGYVRTGGWTNPRLEPRVYVDPPEDGIQEYDFIADEPDGMVTQAIEVVNASHVMQIDALTWIRGVRIYAETNDVERTFESETDPLYEFDCDQVISASDRDLAVTALSHELASNGATILDVNEFEFDEIVDEALEFDLNSIGKCYDFTVFSMKGWPETKTEWENKCILKVGGKCVTKTKVPIVYHRKSTLKVIARVCLPSEDDLRAEVEQCVKEAIAAGVLAGVVTGNLAAIAAALKSYLVRCLTAKGIQAAEGVRVSLTQRKKRGPWKRV
jgi:hypothetical protein